MDIIELVKDLDSELTSGSYEIRCKGVKNLCDTIKARDSNSLSKKEIQVLTEFLCLRLVDHKSMQESVLTCFQYFLGCDNQPERYDKTLLEFFKTKISVQNLDSNIRYTVYSLVYKIVAARHKTSPQIDGDLIYTVIHLVEGEGHPENLMFCFKLISFILKDFQNLEPYVDDIFEWLSSYYPVDYTPNSSDKQESKITRSDLVGALYDCFFATPLNSDNLQTLMLEKLDSNIAATKLESLNCLARCYSTFPTSTIKSYTSSIWTAIRVECLKKKDLVEPKLLSTCLETLACLAKNLTEDGDFYSTFICDIYEELSIAFRKPEMDLFEPAVALIASICRPKLKSFDYLLSKILPISINALKASEYRPLPALIYLFEQLQQYHPNTTLSDEVLNHIADLITYLSERPELSHGRDVLKTVATRLELNRDSIDKIITCLKSDTVCDDVDVQECLALICAKYKRIDIILDMNSDFNFNLESLLEIFSDSYAIKFGEVESRFKLSCYLKLIVHLLDSSNTVCSESTSLQFLENLRSLAINHSDCHQVIDDIGRVHAIIFNKLPDEKLQPLLMSFVGSNYCQRLIPSEDKAEVCTYKVYLPIIAWITKSIAVRNHKFVIPFMNLLLNLLLSQQAKPSSYAQIVNIFAFVVEEASSTLFDLNNGYQVFFLFRQKFYTICKNEVKVRHSQIEDGIKRDCLIQCLTVQLKSLSQQVYKSDHDWLFRESLKALGRFNENPESLTEKGMDAILDTTYTVLSVLIQSATEKSTSNFLVSIIELNLSYATGAKLMKTRRKALTFLKDITEYFDEQELLNLKQDVTSKLKVCLSDKKRLVRQAAAEARLRWILVGQPIGGS